MEPSLQAAPSLPNNNNTPNDHDDTAMTQQYQQQQPSRRGPRSALEVSSSQLDPTEEDDEEDSEEAKRQKKPTTPQKARLQYIILCTIGLGLAFSCPQTKLNTSPDATTANATDVEMQWDVVLQGVFTYLLLLASFFLVSGSDPGYLSPNVLEGFDNDCQTLLDNNHEDNEGEGRQGDEEEGKVGDNHNALHTHNKNNNEDSIENDIDDNPPTSVFFQGTRRRYCPSCRIAPPLRSHHCKQCNQCVATFDHHCDFIGTCIGERNHCRFWWFLLCQLIAFQFFSAIVGSSRFGFTTLFFPSTNVTNAPWTTSLHVIVAKYFFYPLRAIAWIMWIIHTWMALTNSTTFEVSKGPKHVDYLRGTKMSDLPFSKGLMGNMRLFCCQKDEMVTWIMRGINQQQQLPWRPIQWHPPANIVRDSEDWWANPWENKYWSCC